MLPPGAPCRPAKAWRRPGAIACGGCRRDLPYNESHPPPYYVEPHSPHPRWCYSCYLERWVPADWPGRADALRLMAEAAVEAGAIAGFDGTEALTLPLPDPASGDRSVAARVGLTAAERRAAPWMTRLPDTAEGRRLALKWTLVTIGVSPPASGTRSPLRSRLRRRTCGGCGHEWRADVERTWMCPACRRVEGLRGTRVVVLCLGEQV